MCVCVTPTVIIKASSGECEHNSMCAGHTGREDRGMLMILRNAYDMIRATVWEDKRNGADKTMGLDVFAELYMV